jgi:hypothetical protein
MRSLGSFVWSQRGACPRCMKKAFLLRLLNGGIWPHHDFPVTFISMCRLARNGAAFFEESVAVQTLLLGHDRLTPSSLAQTIYRPGLNTGAMPHHSKSPTSQLLFLTPSLVHEDDARTQSATLIQFLKGAPNSMKSRGSANQPIGYNRTSTRQAQRNMDDR